MDAAAVAAVVSRVLAERKVSENALAARAAVPQSTLNRRLSGDPHALTLNEVSRIARALDMKASELVALAERDAS